MKFLALFGAWFWLCSVNISLSNPDFVYHCRGAFTYLHILIAFTLTLNAIRLLLGIYSNLRPYIPDINVAISITMIIFFWGPKLQKISHYHA